MDNELETWIDDVMEKQQYRNGIFSNGGVIHWLRRMTFGKKWWNLKDSYQTLVDI